MADDNLLVQLSEPDAIFEPKTADTLKDFLKSGKPEDAVRALLLGYRGYSEMVNLLARWTEDAGTPTQDIQNILKQHTATRVKEQYDPQQTRSIFQEKNRNVSWMNFMVTKPFWRGVLYELAETHKSDAVLGLALSKIEELGHQDELATILLGFRLFNQALLQIIAKMLESDEQKLLEVLPKFKKMCGQSANTYLYTQMVLLSVAHGSATDDAPGRDRLLRLFQELENHVVSEHKGSRIIPKLGYLLMGLSRHKELSVGMFAMLEKKRTNPADIGKVHRAYTAPLIERPPVTFLRNAAFLEMLVDDLYITGRDVPAKYRDKYIYCLAYATLPDSGLSLSEVEIEKILAERIRAVDLSSTIAKKNVFGAELERYLPLLRHYIASVPVVSMGILTWIRCNLGDQGYYEKGTHSLSLSTFLSLVVDVAATNVLQRSHCVSLLQTAYESVEGAKTEDGMAGEVSRVKVEVLNCVVKLLLCNDGEVIAGVMRWIEGLATRGSTDTTITRHFVRSILEVASPPFSPDFVAFIATLLLACIPDNPNYSYVKQLIRVFDDAETGESIVQKFLTTAFAQREQLSDKARKEIALIQLRILPPEQRPRPEPVKPETRVVQSSSTRIKISNIDPELIKKSGSVADLAGSSAEVRRAKVKQRLESEEAKKASEKQNKSKSKSKAKVKQTKKMKKRARPRWDDEDVDDDFEEDMVDDDEFVEPVARKPRRSIPRNVKQSRKPALSLVLPKTMLPNAAKPKEPVEEKFLDDDDDVELFEEWPKM